MDCEGCAILPPPPLNDTATWVPPLDPKYEWSVDVNADGGTTLYLKVYPFFYEAVSPMCSSIRVSPSTSTHMLYQSASSH